MPATKTKKRQPVPAQWVLDKTLAILAKFPLGMTRTELRRRCGYASDGGLHPVLRALVDRNLVRISLPGFGTQKIYLVRENGDD